MGQKVRELLLQGLLASTTGHSVMVVATACFMHTANCDPLYDTGSSCCIFEQAVTSSLIATDTALTQIIRLSGC
jgi:hypothetical protein